VKIRALIELSDYLDGELAWRKRELTSIRLNMLRARAHLRLTMVRCGVCLLYAHWEGFIKCASTAYVCYVDHQGMRLRDLRHGLLALALHKEFAEAEQTTRISTRSRLVALLRSDLMDRASLPWSTAISTGSNLTSRQLYEILALLGLDDTEYRKKELLLDGRLLDWRNAIAHGEKREIDDDDYVRVHDAVISLVGRFRTDVENAATVAAYRWPATA